MDEDELTKNACLGFSCCVKSTRVGKGQLAGRGRPARWQQDAAVVDLFFFTQEFIDVSTEYSVEILQKDQSVFSWWKSLDFGTVAYFVVI